MNKIGEAFLSLFWLLIILVPFGIWKIIDIIIWLLKHIHIILEK